MQLQYPDFSCSLPCHFLAVRAAFLCYGMDPSPSPLWLGEQHGLARNLFRKKSKDKESGCLWNDQVSFSFPEFASYCRSMLSMEAVGYSKREN